MKRPPPTCIRRLVIDPAFVIVAVVVLVSLPLWLVIAAFASRYVPGRWRPLRVTWFLVLYVALEALMLVILFAVWIASGFGWRQRSPAFVELHYRLARWWLGRVMGSAARTFHLVTEREDDLGRISPGRPILVFSRHAGPGDSFLLVHGLLHDADRRPSIVLKDTLQWDPCIDVLLNRLPARFVPASRRAGQVVIDSIGELAGRLDSRGALVLFPEGGNFTPRRRLRAIEKLDEIGRPDLAERARALEHLLPPKPTGAMAAIAASAGSDVVFVGHTGLERLSTLRDLWRGIPMDSHVVGRAWRVPSEQIPAAPHQEAWLYEQWEAIDTWIDDTLVREAAAEPGRSA